MKTGEKKAIFLDRDGTINFDLGYVYRIEDWKWADPQVPKALGLLQANGYELIVVTNQSGIGHGLYTEQDMQRLHEFMTGELAKEGVKISLIEFCPHARDSGCGCRKPGTLMIEEAVKKMGGVDLAASWTIGDKMLDMEMGQKVGTRTVLLTSKYWHATDLLNRAKQPDYVADTLLAAAQWIVAEA